MVIFFSSIPKNSNDQNGGGEILPRREENSIGFNWPTNSSTLVQIGMFLFVLYLKEIGQKLRSL